MRRLRILIAATLFAAHAAKCAAHELQAHERLSANSAVKTLVDGTIIRGFSFDLVPAKKNYFVFTLYYSSAHSRKVEHTVGLRPGDFCPESEDYVVVSVRAWPVTIGTPQSGLAATAITEAIIKHREKGITYRFRHGPGGVTVEHAKKT